MLSCALRRSRPPTRSAPAKSIRTSSLPSVAPRSSTAWPPFATTSPKLRAKGLVEKLPRSRRYRLLAKGYSVCLIFLKLFDRVYAPLTAALLRPIPADRALPNRKRSPLDRLYQRLTDTLDHLLWALGLAFARPVNENKILVDALMPPITAYAFSQNGLRKSGPCGAV